MSTSEIVDLLERPASEWKPVLLSSYTYSPYWWIRGVTPESRRALMNRQLDQLRSASARCLLGSFSAKGDLTGFAQMKRLDWDSEHFGAEIWRLDHAGAWGDEPWQVGQSLVEALVDAARARGITSVQARIPIGNLPLIHALEGCGFRTVEILNTWMFNFEKWPIPDKAHPELIRDAEPSDAEPLIELARTAYAPTPDRFHADPRLPEKASNELYAEWMRASFSGDMADNIAVAVCEGRPVGYSTCKDFGDFDGLSNARLGMLGLAAMLPRFRNRGLTTDLTIHNLQWFRELGGDYCTVGTQGNNIPSQRVWMKIGFRPGTMDLTLHLWLKQ